MPDPSPRRADSRRSTAQARPARRAPASPPDPASADEQQNRREQWHRLRCCLLRPSRRQCWVAIVLLVFGALIGTQVRSPGTSPGYQDARREDLVQLLDAANAETRRLESELNQLRGTRDRLQSGADSAKVAEAESKKRLDQLAILAGTVPATGPGIRVVVYDSQQKVGANIILDVVEEFRDAGAEVIEINDSVRVVASTWFADTPAGLVADGTVIARPLVLDVIGDPQALEGAVRFRGGLMSQVQASAISGSVTITRPAVVTISALHQVREHRYARPA